MPFDNSPETKELREQAKSLGLKFHPSTGAKKLRKMMAAHADATMGISPADIEEDRTAEVTVVETEEETKGQKLERIKLEQLRLIRVVVHCNNDDKQELQGDIFSVRNGYVGPVKRFVPFDNENGWHIEKILLDFLKSKRTQKWRNVKLPNGMTEKQPFQVNEYTITELPPLTHQELNELAQRQAARGSIDV